ncbi:MAG: YgeY family selenium metabolism-linked hydrolase [Candidatus Riflebacteria bacterium]|nr:YgeY family selenium metabolism-linked hydrolase [Candidatus Riflebacteria bacterium]
MSNAKKIMELAEKYRDYTANNLAKMVKIPSESMQEKDVQAEVVRQMKEAGFDEVRVDGLGNVIGRIGSGKTVLAIDGHVDTVGVGNRVNWDFDPFLGEVKDGYVWGRGTIDQEGGIAASITAGRILKELGFDKDVTFYVVSSVMEEDCDGLCWKYLVEEEKLKPDFVISTEPTNLNIYRGHRGRMEIGVDFRGLSCHGSAPERGRNAAYMASKFALEIEKLNERLQPDSDNFLGKGTVTISEFKSGSPSLCAVADFVHIHLDRRLTWGETKESAVKEVEECIKLAGLKVGEDAKVTVLHYEEVAYTGLKYGMEKYFPTWKIPETEHVVQAGVKSFKELFDKDPKVDKWTFSTNGVTINGYYKIPMIGFGPGNEVYAHAPNEKIPVDDLVKASAFYAQYAHNI